LEGIGLPFAIKFLSPSVFNDDRTAATKRFFREAEVLFRLRHPHIIPIYGVGQHDGRPYILMELFQGMNLFEARKRGGTPDPDAVLPFLYFVCDALAHAHAKNIVHRDLKPQNLMTVRGDARVLDFGVAGLLDPNGERFTKSSDAVAGDAFSAPELTENPMLIDPRCDIYSLGACWYWLLTGLSPKGVNWESRLRASVKISQPYERVLLRCLDQADKRYPSAPELLSDIRALRQGNLPSLSPHDLTDDQARVLGVVVTNCATSRESAALYAVEQEIGKRQTRLRTSLALRTLVQRGMIEEAVESDDFGRNDYTVYRPLDAGIGWAERNVARIEDLLAPVEIPVDAAAAQGDSEDIPF
jgi:serine/threonine protein kinase